MIVYLHSMISVFPEISAPRSSHRDHRCVLPRWYAFRTFFEEMHVFTREYSWVPQTLWSYCSIESYFANIYIYFWVVRNSQKKKYFDFLELRKKIRKNLFWSTFSYQFSIEFVTKKQLWLNSTFAIRKINIYIYIYLEVIRNSQNK